LLTHRQTNKQQTKTGKNITSLAEVIKVWTERIILLYVASLSNASNSSFVCLYAGFC